jgi:hypothetical protein
MSIFGTLLGMFVLAFTIAAKRGRMNQTNPSWTWDCRPFRGDNRKKEEGLLNYKSVSENTHWLPGHCAPMRILRPKCRI